MATRKGLRVTCAVCRRVFYLQSWGEDLPEHRIGRGDEDPDCSGTRRAAYLPASTEAMTAQLEWVADQSPETPRRRAKTKPAGKAVDARDKELAGLKGGLVAKRKELERLLGEGVRAYEQRRDASDQQATMLMREQENLLKREISLRAEIKSAAADVTKLEGRLAGSD